MVKNHCLANLSRMPPGRSSALSSRRRLRVLVVRSSPSTLRTRRRTARGAATALTGWKAAPRRSCRTDGTGAPSAACP
jgi:hypothetical protein